MKKFIFLLIGLFAFVALQAQTTVVSSRSTYGIYAAADADADTIKAATSLTKVISVKKDYLYFYDITVDIDTLTGGGDNPLSCVLWGYNDSNYPVSITDVTFAATADTVIRYTDLSTGVLWNYFKLVITGDGASAAAQLMNLNIKVAQKPD